MQCGKCNKGEIRITHSYTVKNIGRIASGTCTNCRTQYVAQTIYKTVEEMGKGAYAIKSELEKRKHLDPGNGKDTGSANDE